MKRGKVRKSEYAGVCHDLIYAFERSPGCYLYMRCDKKI